MGLPGGNPSWKNDALIACQYALLCHCLLEGLAVRGFAGQSSGLKGEETLSM